MDEPRDSHTKSDKDKHHVVIYMWNLKKTIQMNLCTKQTDSHTEKLTVTKGERGDKLVGV